jgi:filamentous hemagglutinin
VVNDPNSEQMRKAAEWAAKATEIARQIAGGHAYKKHVLEQDEFPWIETREEFRDFIAGIMRKPTSWKPLKDGRRAYLDARTGTIVIRDPNHIDGGTAYRRPDARRHFNELK